MGELCEMHNKICGNSVVLCKFKSRVALFCLFHFQNWFLSNQHIALYSTHISTSYSVTTGFWPSGEARLHVSVRNMACTLTVQLKFVFTSGRPLKL